MTRTLPNPCFAGRATASTPAWACQSTVAPPLASIPAVAARFSGADEDVESSRGGSHRAEAIDGNTPSANKARKTLPTAIRGTANPLAFGTDGRFPPAQTGGPAG